MFKKTCQIYKFAKSWQPQQLASTVLGALKTTHVQLYQLFAMSFIAQLSEFSALCSDNVKCATACRVFVDLQQDTRLKNLEKCYDAALDIIYLCAVRADTRVIFLPVLSSLEIDLVQLERIQEKFNCSIILAICDSSSNILYYEIQPGFIEKPLNKTVEAQ